MFEALNLIFIVGLLVTAVLVVRVRRVLDAILLFSASGIFLTLIFLQMQAPDVALSEASVGAVAIPMVLLISLAKIRSLLDDPKEAE